MFKKAAAMLQKAEIALIVVAYCTLCVLILAEIIMRNFFQSGIYWLEEFGRYLLVISTFLGASIAVTKEDHPRMEAIVLAVPKRVSKGMRIVGNFVCCIGTGYLTYFALRQVLHMQMIGTRTSTLPIPMWVIYLVFPLSLLGMCIRFLLLLLEEIRSSGAAEAVDAEAEEA